MHMCVCVLCARTHPKGMLASRRRPLSPRQIGPWGGRIFLDPSSKAMSFVVVARTRSFGLWG